MNYYPFNVGDYAAHTAHLEPMEDLAYRRLLDVYYLREGPLPADIQATAKLIRMRSMAADVESVLREFFVLADDGWRHKRCDQEIERMQDKQAKARASAQVSVSVRRANAERTLKGKEANAERTLGEEAADVELPTPTPTPEEECTHTPLARDWVLPKAWGEWALTEFQGWTAETVRAVASQFADHWRASGGTSADWRASWQKWCRDPLTHRAVQVPPQQPQTRAGKPAAPSITVPSADADRTAAYLAERDAKGHDPPPPSVAERLAKAKAAAAMAALPTVPA